MKDRTEIMHLQIVFKIANDLISDFFNTMPELCIIIVKTLLLSMANDCIEPVLNNFLDKLPNRRLQNTIRETIFLERS